MNTPDERPLIYTALGILCAIIGTIAGFAGALSAFVQIAAVIELIHWVGTRAGDTPARDS